jgi:hypothetical protein
LAGVDINRYAYAGDDPINGSDANGHLSESEANDIADQSKEATKQAELKKKAAAELKAKEGTKSFEDQMLGDLLAELSKIAPRDAGQKETPSTLSQKEAPKLELSNRDYCVASCATEFSGEATLSGAAILQGLGIKSKRGGVSLGGKSGPVTSYGSSTLRKVTGNARVKPPFDKVIKKAFGTTSIGGAVSKFIGWAGVVGGLDSAAKIFECTATCSDD